MIDPASLTLGAAIAAFLVSAIAIGFIGPRIARLAKRLADATGWGEAVFGAVFLGASTSLSGIVTSVTAASGGHADLAFSNALGGIAAQTVFLAVADMSYRKVNLEHAAASVPNMMQGALLIVLLMLTLLFITSPETMIRSVHPGSLVLPGVYILGMKMIALSRRESTWVADPTPETVVDRGEDGRVSPEHGLSGLWLRFTLLAGLLALSGYVVAHSGVAVAVRTGMSETVVGSLFTAVTTSLPELVTVVAAVRTGALTMAVGDIIGGNSFDVLFVAVSDVAYRKGSIYHALGGPAVFVIGLASLLTAILLLGLLRREKRGIANIGFESFLVLVLYVGGFVVLTLWL